MGERSGWQIGCLSLTHTPLLVARWPGPCPPHCDSAWDQVLVVALFQKGAPFIISPLGIAAHLSDMLKQRDCQTCGWSHSRCASRPGKHTVLRLQWVGMGTQPCVTASEPGFCERLPSGVLWRPSGKTCARFPNPGSKSLQATLPWGTPVPRACLRGKQKEVATQQSTFYDRRRRVSSEPPNLTLQELGHTILTLKFSKMF
jgi:hypothetical protein